MLPKLGLYNFVSGASSPAGRGLPKVRTFLQSLVDAPAGTSEPQFRCNRPRNLRIAARPFGNEQVHWQVMDDPSHESMMYCLVIPGAAYIRPLLLKSAQLTGAEPARAATGRMMPQQPQVDPCRRDRQVDCDWAAAVWIRHLGLNFRSKYSERHRPRVAAEAGCPIMTPAARPTAHSTGKAAVPERWLGSSPTLGHSHGTVTSVTRN